MRWFKRWRNKIRNYTSSGDYPGSYGGGSGAPPSQEFARREAVNRLRDSQPPQ